MDGGEVMDNLQNVDTWIWVAVAVVVGLIIVGTLATLGKRKKRDWDHSRAEAIRREVEQQRPGLQKREASALETEAQAERARADADRLAAQAREQRRDVEDQRSTLTERLQEADERDPDVDTNVDAHKHVDAARRPD
jgi:uncharacterized membrane-anchored protein YhcB (DUF1043 family)